jgi:hypothetical protein
MKNRRKHYRHGSYFTVQFRLLNAQAKEYLSEWLLGFTKNVGKAGLCLKIEHLNEQLFSLIQERRVKILLDVHLPVSRKPVRLIAKVAWVRQDRGVRHRCFVGLTYDEPLAKESRQIVYAALTQKFMIIFLAALASLLLVGIIQFLLR